MSLQTNTTHDVVMATEIVLPRVGEPETLQVQHRALAELMAGQVLVQVEATGVSFAEKSMLRGQYPGQPAFPFVPGYDLVGTVTRLGPSVTEVAVGQRIAALIKTGGWTDHIVLSVDDLIPVPDGLDAAAVETMVVNGATAWGMLHDMAKVRSGQTIVVHGATGGVGVMLVQVARAAGVRVIGTASPSKFDFVRTMGAEPLDYHSDDLLAEVRKLAPDGVNAVFDPLGGKSVDNSWRMLGPGGTLVASGIQSKIGSDESLVVQFTLLLLKICLWNVLPNGRHAHFFDVNSGKMLQPRKFHQRLRTALTEVFALLAQGRIQAHIASRVPLEQAAEAMRLADSGKTMGKIVLIPGL